jgi:hypothetical protein
MHAACVASHAYDSSHSSAYVRIRQTIDACGVCGMACLRQQPYGCDRQRPRAPRSLSADYRRWSCGARAQTECCQEPGRRVSVSICTFAPGKQVAVGFTAARMRMHELKRCGFILRAWLSIVYFPRSTSGVSICTFVLVQQGN